MTPARSAGRNRALAVAALIVGLSLGMVIATRPSQSQEAPPLEDAVTRVGDFTDKVLIPIDHEGHWMWTSDLLTTVAARNADAYVVEPRLVGVQIENATMVPVETDAGIKLVYEFDVVEFEPGGLVAILDARADESGGESSGEST